MNHYIVYRTKNALTRAEFIKESDDGSLELKFATPASAPLTRASQYGGVEMKSWTFYSAETGQELCAGWQGTDEQAWEMALRKANETGAAVEYGDSDGLAGCAEPDNEMAR